MERNKKARKPLRTAVTKTIAEVDAVISSDTPDRDVLRDKLRKLEDLEMRLSELDVKILEELLEGEEVDYEIEFNATEEYSDKIRTTKMKANKLLGQSETPIILPISTNDEGMRKFKLPKIELKKFGGDLCEWLGWWSQFEKIHEDSTLHPSDKFQYLVQATVEGSRARRVVDGYPQTASNYPKAVLALKDRFGDKILLTEIYVRRLAGLVIANASKPTATSLSVMFDELESSLRSLESLGVTTEQSAAFLYPLVESSLPQEILRVWQRSSLSGYDAEEDKRVDERLSSLMKFLRREVRGEERLSFVTAGLHHERKRRPHTRTPPANFPTAAGLVAVEHKCIFCDKAHESKDCGKVSNWTLEEKRKRVEEKRCCYACLKPGHAAKKCKSFAKCVLCGKRHLVILCPDLEKAKNHEYVEKNQQEDVQTVMTSFTRQQVILQTLQVSVVGPKGHQQVRALVDTGSQRSYILSSTARKLGIKPHLHEKLAHSVFGGNITKVESFPLYTVNIKGTSNTKAITMQMLGHDKICSFLPAIPYKLCSEVLSRNNIVISDSKGNGSEIEMLFGAEHYPLIMIGKQVRVSPEVLAVETKLGWTLIGKISAETLPSCGTAMLNAVLMSNTLENLWRLDTLGIRDSIEVQSEAESERCAYQQFLDNVSRDDHGRYVVALPWISAPTNFSSNRWLAEKRLHNLSSRLSDKNATQVYSNVFHEWLEEGLIEKVPDPTSNANCFYLPHRPVWKPSSESTPVRPVFDASCRAGSNPSLNDMLYKGPNLLEIIPAVLLRFRRFAVGVTADIRKAFQTIVVRNQDRSFLRFLWRDGADLTEELQHTRVVFGVKSSPFLLAAVLRLHLTSELEHKDVATKLLNAFYVDNCVCSLTTYAEFENFRTTAVKVLSKAHMQLRQWEVTAGDGTGVGSLVGRECGLGPGSGDDPEIQKNTTTVLGLRWDKLSDTLFCMKPSVTLAEVVTKRCLLSVVSKIFDPIGIVAPATLIPKLILQETWVSKMRWEDKLTGEMLHQFNNWVEGVNSIEDIRIPRHTLINNFPQDIEFHVFSDACSYAYAAVIFVRSEHKGQIDVRFVSAKARVAPIRRPTIPRLELMAAYLGSKIFHQTKDVYSSERFKVTFWSDSACVLAWIRGAAEWGTFVGNRVKQICELTEKENWRHIPGIHNPADIASRGASFKELLTSRWYQGPEWLRLPKKDWPISEPIYDYEEINKEVKKTSFVMTQIVETPWYVFTSSYQRNLRIMAWIIRFIDRCRGKVRKGSLKADEIDSAEQNVMRLIQGASFPDLQEVICGVRVYEDEKKLKRVMTKLLHTEDLSPFKAPVLLPADHIMVKQLIHYVHVVNGHAGVQFIMAKLRETVWVVRARKAVKDVVRRCVICRRFSQKPSPAQPAALPEDRVKSTKAFEVSGVDIAGPLYLRNGSKVWIALFTCAVFRCVHLEIVQSMSTDAFMLALQKFICRRGRPTILWSDNGTNFRGSHNAIKKLNWKEIEDRTAISRITWKFIPPSSPWWGGWWERLVRVLKDLLRRMLGHKKLNLPQLESMLCTAETTINERPLTYVSSEQDDLIPLTPQLFLHALPSSGFPEANLINADYLKDRFKSLKQMRNELVNRFRREYLSQLVHHTVGVKTKPLAVGEIVLVGIDTKKRSFWPIGRIEELLPGKDGHCRVAKVKVKGNTLIRPIQRLYRLEVTDDLPQQSQLTISPKPRSVTATRYGRIVKKTQRF